MYKLMGKKKLQSCAKNVILMIVYVFSVDNFNVGLDLSITIEVRPRSLNGVLFSVHGKGDFVALQLVSGEVRRLETMDTFMRFWY